MNFKAISRVFSALLILSLVGEVRAGGKHPFSVHDLVSMERISEPQVSPDGKQVVFVLRKTDLEQNKGIRHLWLVNTDGTGFQQLTTQGPEDFNPQWSADGKSVYFLSSRTGTVQVWRISPQGGEARQVTDLPLDAGNLLLSPDGKRMALTLDVFPGCPDLKGTVDRLGERNRSKQSGRIFENIPIRHWDAWRDGTCTHLFCLNIDGTGITDVMKGMEADCPSKPFGGPEEFCFTPDGGQIVFTAKAAGREEAWSTNFDLFMAPADGTKSPECLTPENKAWDTQPCFTPDGKTLAWLAMSRPGYESDRYRIMLRSWPSGAGRELAPSWDRSPGSLFWSADGKILYAIAGNVGQQSLFAIEPSSGRIRTVIDQGTVRSAACADGRLMVALENLESPTDLFTMKPDGSGLKPVTRVNAEKLASVQMGEPEQFSFKGWNGETVYGYAVKPAPFEPGKKYPVAFLIHGGPQGSFGNDFHYRWNPQVYAGAGYAALMIDFHGSTGYGQAFTDAIRGDWGGKPLEDLQKGLDAALAKYPWMEGEQVAALGASYGGYMINWIAGQWPDRFKCLVCHDGNVDTRMAYLDTEELWFPEWEHEGTPWDNPESFEKHNPLRFISNWKTPMLVIQGEMDYRIPVTQGIATFNALQRRGIPSRLLYFPDENHWVLKPQNSIQWHETVIGWLDRWTK
jgi:dipeptidyl aminopeptidase/acylaminoacyl peptidase